MEGPDGFAGSWTAGKYMCPGAGTETMRMVDCDASGCRLEVKFEDEWGSVCSRGFAEITGEQVCKMLGFHRGGTAILNKGGGRDMVWLANVKCRGNEGDIGDCQHSVWGANDCAHGEDVGICCWGRDTAAKGVRVSPSFFPRCPSAESPEPEEDDEDEEEDEENDASKAPKPVQNQMRLTDCSRFACRLEVLHEEKWGTVCEKGFTDGAAEMVCQALGCATPWSVAPPRKTERDLQSLQKNLRRSQPELLPQTYLPIGERERAREGERERAREFVCVRESLYTQCTVYECNAGRGLFSWCASCTYTYTTYFSS